MYTAHEVRTIIRNCATVAELRRVELEILIYEMHNYSILVLMAFEAAIRNQKFKITKKYEI